MVNKIELLERSFLKEGLPKFVAGDTVKVYVKIKEEEKTRIQVFEGIVIRKHGSGVKETFTVRRISYGEGVERIFPVHSPSIDKIEVVKKGRVKRARLYYLRDRVGRHTGVEEDIKEEDAAADENISKK